MNTIHHHIWYDNGVLNVKTIQMDDGQATVIADNGVPVAEISDWRRPLLIVGEPIDHSVGGNGRLTDNPLRLAE